MSEASSPAWQASGMSSPKGKTFELLDCMKLRAPNDPFVHQKISQWVAAREVQTNIPPSKAMACRVSSSLLLQRLVRAFENRLGSPVDDTNKMKNSGSKSNGSKPSAPTNGNATKETGSPKFKGFIRAPKKLPKKLPAFHALMQRKVKVTQLVKNAFLFVGSDVLKVLQVAVPSPTVADVATYCISLLNDEKTIKDFYLVFCEASEKDPATFDEPSAIFFGVFALQALQSLRAQAISTYEFSHDFEYIYRKCYQDRNFRMCMHEMNPAMKPFEGTTSGSYAPDTEAQNICWKLARLLALKYDYEKKSNPDVRDHRRNLILSSASSIVLAANIGKSVKNAEVGTDTTEEKGTLDDDEDFSTLAFGPVSDLLRFLAQHTSQNQGLTPISNADIISHAVEACKWITQVGMGQKATGNIDPSNSKSLLGKAFSPANCQLLVKDYRNVINNLVTETQKELKINITNQGKGDVRTGIVDVLMFFPMVIGEQWGVPCDAPVSTCKMFCLGEHSKPSDFFKESVAVVMNLLPKATVPKRKAESNEPNVASLNQNGSKRAKTIPSLEPMNQSVNKDWQGQANLDEEVSTSSAEQKGGGAKAHSMNDTSEVNEWTLSILSLSVIKPTDSLLSYIEENDRRRGDGSSCLQDVIVPLLNRGALRIQNAVRHSSTLHSEVMPTKVSVGRRDGQVYVDGAVDNIVQLCASVVGFYYCSLEAIILDQMERIDFLGSFGSQLQSGSFHRALLACCYSCILKGVGIYPKLSLNKICEDITIQDLVDCTESDPFTFLKVIDAFSRALIATKEASKQRNRVPVIAGLPEIIYEHTRKIEVQLIDSLIWSTQNTSKLSTESCFVNSINAMKNLPGAWPPDILEPMLPEELTDLESDSSQSTDVRCKPSFGSSAEGTFISLVMRKLLKFIFFRIRALCVALNLSNEGSLHTQILVAFRYLLRHHISIFVDRHVDQLLLCTIYGVCRVMEIQPVISFGKVIDAYLTVRGDNQGERACRMIVRHVKLAFEGNEIGSSSQGVGNIVVFYNTVYIPKMQRYFLGSKSLKERAKLYQRNCAKEDGCTEKKLRADTFANTSSSVTADADITETSQFTDSQSKSATVRPGDKNRSNKVHFSNETASTNGTSPMMEDSTESDPITIPSIATGDEWSGKNRNQGFAKAN